MKRTFTHITLAQAWKLTLDLICVSLIGLAIFGLVGVIGTIIMDPSVIDGASFGIYG